MTQVRQFRPGDEEAINRGFNEVFHVERNLAEWAWKFPPSGSGRAITLVEREGEVQAHFAGLPLAYQIDGRVVRAFSVVDVYARPTARSGLARRADMEETATAFFEIFGASGETPFVLGFPSPRHRRLGALRFGYEIVPPNPLTLFQRSGCGQAFRPRRYLYRAELAADWEPRLDDLWRRVRGAYPVSMVRDSEMALRRFAGHPHAVYHRFLVFPRMSDMPVAWVVFRIEQACCWWVDLLWDHEHPGALELVSTLSSGLCGQYGIEHEALWLEGDQDGQSALAALGFAGQPDPKALCLVVRRLDANFDPALLADRAFITMADADLI